MCQIPHQEATNIIPPFAISCGKICGLRISAIASPEFCIPVSIAIVRLSGIEDLVIVLNKYPVARAIKLCIKTMTKTYLIYFIKILKLAANAIATIIKNIITDRFCIFFSTDLVKIGNRHAIIMPNISGSPSIIRIVVKTSGSGISSGLKRLEDLEYKLPQNLKFSGVKKIDNTVPIAVRLIDNSTFPFEIEDMKLEILPPGHAATRIKPIAMVCVILSFAR